MKEKKDLDVLRHSAAHLLAHAVSDLFPDTLLTIGPATPDGFFYDFLPQEHFKEKDLATIAARMRELAEQNLPITHEEISKKEARALYTNNPFKLELIDQIPGDTVGLSRQGDFYDLCRGGHVASTGEIKYFTLTGLAGAYWRGAKTKPALQRIYGTAFFSSQDLAAFEERKELAAKYDHRRLGKQLELFSFSDEGVGFPFFHPKGMRVIIALVSYMRNLYREYGYEEVLTPTMLKSDLWKRSGHYEHYKENMYFCEIDDEEYEIKPMNCPGAFLVYKTRPRSYRELPLRLAEFGHVHRHELSGALHGLMRVRAFTQDDAHIFCTVEQIEDEIVRLLDMVQRVLHRFGFERIFFALSTKPAKALGSEELWHTATEALKNALKRAGITYEIKEGEGAFYGPKIDFDIEDSMGRRWQCATIQLDFFQPENFGLEYVSPRGDYQRPVVIHRAIFGSLERFLGILLEHHRGRLPFFIAPIQARVLTITDEQKPYGKEIVEHLKSIGMRVDMDESSDPINAQIKTAQLEQIPWMLVVGKKEAANKTITLRHLDGTQEAGLSLAAIQHRAQELDELLYTSSKPKGLS